MKIAKRTEKENRIIDAAERIFDQVGFKNAKMEEISKEAGITKVTLYSYFHSKENLYMAVTYRAFQLLNDAYYNTVSRYQSKPGIESALAVMETMFDFFEKNFLYSEALLNYFSLVRSTEQGKHKAKLTGALQQSIYYMKIQDIQNIPFRIAAKEIQRGVQDGSVKNKLHPMFLSIQAWTMATGYVKVIAASGSNYSPFFHFPLSALKNFTLDVSRKILESDEYDVQTIMGKSR